MSSPGADSKKKTLIAAEQEREDVAQKRRDWKQNQNEINPDHVVFIDETWAKTNMTRTCGRSQCGTRVIEGVPFGRWETTTFVGALRATGFTAPLAGFELDDDTELFDPPPIFFKTVFATKATMIAITIKVITFFQFISLLFLISLK